MAVESKDLITVREAARECGRTAETVRRWIWEGKLRAQKLGNQLFVKRADLAYIVSRLGGQDIARSLATLDDARVVRDRIRQRIGGTLDILETLDRSREAHS